MADYEYRLANGWVSSATLLANANYNIENYPNSAAGSGRRPDWYWGPPDKGLTTRAQRPQYVTTLGMTQRAHGLYFFQWGFKFMPHHALQALYGQVGFSTDVADDTTQSSQVTVRHLVHGAWTGAGSYTTTLPVGTYSVFQCWLHKCRPGIDFKAIYGGFEDVILRFTGGTKL